MLTCLHLIVILLLMVLAHDKDDDGGNDDGEDQRTVAVLDGNLLVEDVVLGWVVTTNAVHHIGIVGDHAGQNTDDNVLGLDHFSSFKTFSLNYYLFIFFRKFLQKFFDYFIISD